jgi:hypothetical protein
MLYEESALEDTQKHTNMDKFKEMLALLLLSIVYRYRYGYRYRYRYIHVLPENSDFFFTFTLIFHIYIFVKTNAISCHVRSRHHITVKKGQLPM